jgi:hypothetical protein
MTLHYRVRLGRRFDPLGNAHQFMRELEHYFSSELVRGQSLFIHHAACTLCPNPAETRA